MGRADEVQGRLLGQSAEQVCSHLGSAWHISAPAMGSAASVLISKVSSSLSAPTGHGLVSTVTGSARIWELSCHEPPWRFIPQVTQAVSSEQELRVESSSFSCG